MTQTLSTRFELSSLCVSGLNLEKAWVNDTDGFFQKPTRPRHRCCRFWTLKLLYPPKNWKICKSRRAYFTWKTTRCHFIICWCDNKGLELARCPSIYDSRSFWLDPPLPRVRSWRQFGRKLLMTDQLLPLPPIIGRPPPRASSVGVVVASPNKLPT